MNGCDASISTDRRSATAVAREEFLAWGTPYEIVTGKLHPWAPALTQSLQPQLVTEIATALLRLYFAQQEHIAHTPAPSVASWWCLR